MLSGTTALYKLIPVQTQHGTAACRQNSFILPTKAQLQKNIDLEGSMFGLIFKNTYKNLFRSVAFWFAFIMLIGIVVYSALDVSYITYDLNLNEQILDNDPRWVYTYDFFVKQADNVCNAKVFLYAMPLFIIVTVVLILNRDFGDAFYEIEKASGIKPSTYIFPRLAALLTLNIAVMVLMSFVGFHLYTATRSMVEGMTLASYLKESTVRLLYIITFDTIPAIIFYIAMTYMIGTIFKNGIPAAMASIGFVIANYVLRFFFSVRLPKNFFDYLPATPNKARDYFARFGTESFQSYIKLCKVSVEQAMAAIAIVVSFATVFLIFCYILTKKRTAK